MPFKRIANTPEALVQHQCPSLFDLWLLFVFSLFLFGLVVFVVVVLLGSWVLLRKGI